MAFVHLKSGNLILSESFYKDVLDINSTNFDALSGLLFIYLQQDNQAKSNDIIIQLAQFQELVIQSLLEEGEWLLENGSPDMQESYLRKYLRWNLKTKQ